jgi:hypothetical protein
MYALNRNEILEIAIATFGLESDTTLVIANIVELEDMGLIATEYADHLANLIFDDAVEMVYDEVEEEEPDYDALAEAFEQAEAMEQGFNPYLGCYDFDC